MEIRPIKNTRIIEVISTSTNSEESKHQVNNTIEKIINEHASIFDKKRSDFLKYANEIYNKDLAPNKKNMLNMLDSASSSNATQQISEISTTEFYYGGNIRSKLSIAFVLGLSLSLVSAFLKDFFESKKLFSKNQCRMD